MKRRGKERWKGGKEGENMGGREREREVESERERERVKGNRWPRER